MEGWGKIECISLCIYFDTSDISSQIFIRGYSGLFW